MAEHLPKHERLRRATLQEAWDAMSDAKSDAKSDAMSDATSDDLQERGRGRQAPGGADPGPAPESMRPAASMPRHEG